MRVRRHLPRWSRDSGAFEAGAVRRRDDAADGALHARRGRRAGDVGDRLSGVCCTNAHALSIADTTHTHTHQARDPRCTRVFWVALSSSSLVVHGRNACTAFLQTVYYYYNKKYKIYIHISVHTTHSKTHIHSHANIYNILATHIAFRR